jgi:DNA mismatch repair ATPase MutS
MLFAMPIVGSLDRDKIIYPLRDNMKKSDALQQVLALFGQLDELLALHRYAQKFGTATVLPDLVETPQHWLTLQAVRNPILAFENPDYVPNDIKIGQENLLFITGPNSGGKTAFSKTLAQVQMMAQIGSYVPAEKAELCTAQLISYQTPEFNRLGDSEGRFGTELQHTKRIFLATTPRSLVILDEIAEGTTQTEKVEIASNVLQGFHKIGNTTILITHNHELVERFQNDGMGCFRQAEFIHDTPTYKLIDGISKVSHADRIASRIGFGKDDIARYLGDKGVADNKP